MSLKKNIYYLLIAAVLILSACSKEVPVFDADNAFTYLQKQMEFGPRNPGSTGHSACRDWLVSELKRFSPRVARQNFKHFDARLDTTIVMTNIIASFNTESKQRIVLCAHWDTRPFADMDKGANALQPVPGANDGASGVAVLLEIARLMHMQSPPIGVDIVLFDGEDYGPQGSLDEYFLGSRYFANNLATYRPRFGILLDMVGDAQLSLPVEYNSKMFASFVVDKVWGAAEQLGYSEFSRNIGSSVNDDHIQLNQAGIPCVDIIDFQYPDKSHKYWHTLQDTADKCSPQSLKVVGQTVLQVIYNEDV